MRLSKGISPVVATIILVIIAVVAGLMLWSFVLRQMQTRPVVSLEAYVKDAVVSPDGSEVAISVLLQNNGNVPLNITSITAEVVRGSSTIALTLTEGKLPVWLGSGASITWTGTFRASTTVYDGDTIKVTIRYTDSKGQEGTKILYATLHG